MATRSDSGATRRRLGFFRRITLRLIVIALVPAAGLATFATDETFGRRDAAEVADAVQQQTELLADIVELRFLLSKEQIPTMALSLAPAYGVSIEDAEQMLGTDLSQRLDDSRAAVDAVLDRRPTDDDFIDAQAAVRDIRAGYDAQTLDGMAIYGRFSEVLDALDGRVASESLATFDALPDTSGILRTHEAVDQLLVVHRLVRKGSNQLPAFFAAEVPGFAPTADTPSTRLAEATALYRDAVGNASQFTGTAALVWERISRHEDLLTFERAVDDTLAGRSPAFLDDLVASGATVRAGLDRYDLHFQLLEAGRADLEQATVVLRTEALNSFAQSIVLLFVVLVLSILVVYYTGRSITRPLQRLARQAAAVSAGDVHTAHAVSTSGPIEVQTVGHAFQDVVANLQAIDAQALALAAGRLDDPVLAEPLPGRLGESVQASVQLLSQSIADREELHRRLAHEATHDGLTGVPNRSAAMFTL